MPPPVNTAVVSEYENYSSKNGMEKRLILLGRTDFDNGTDNSFYSEILEQKSPIHCKPSTAQQESNVPNKLRRHNMINSKCLNEENNQIKTKNKIPTPYAWSPSISKSLYPSISITPEKSSSIHSDYNNFESQVLNKIPQPVAWSPGMTVHPNPSLLVTPEKLSTKKVDGDSPDYDYENSILILKTFDKQETLKDNDKVMKSKERHCVRFDLPSASSGEETLDDLSSSESPITLKGSDINNCSSPVWKPFSLKKNYNPNDYSDDSILDDSTLSTSITYFNNTSLLQPAAANNAAINQQNKTNSSSKLTMVSTYDSISDLTKSHQLLSKPNVLNKKIVKSQEPKEELKFLHSSSEPTLTPALSVVREDRSKHISTEYSFPFDSGAVAGDTEYEHIFARPEFNSTLKLRGELDSVSHQEVDAVKALETALAKSETKRAELNEKAASSTNRRSNQFRDLVDIDPSVESLCERVVRMRTSKIPSKANVPKTNKKIENAPDLMEFFTSDLQKETPDLSMLGLAQVSPQLAIAPHEIAFDLYRHNRMWLGINDF